MKKIKLAILSIIFGIGSLILAWAWFGWKMALVLFLLNFAINCDQEMRKYE